MEWQALAAIAGAATVVVAIAGAAIALRSTIAQVRQTQLNQDEAERYPIPWRVARKSKSKYLLTNEGSEPCHDVEIAGAVIGDTTRGVLGQGESLSIIDVSSHDQRKGITVYWRRPGEEGAEKRQWSHPLS